MLIAIARFCRGREGSVMVEFAFAATLFFLLLLGGFEVGRFMLLHQKLSRVAADSSDLVSRAEELTAADVQQVFEAAEFILNPFDLGDDGLLIITSVSTIANETPSIDWQFDGAGTGTGTSEIGSGAGQTAVLPDGFTMRPDENVIIAEVFYDYEPFFGVVTTSQTIYYTGTHRPRFGPLNELQ
ncbi:MAG: TadE/TadG family type IV pilus assembly protein [Pseudomonadota bacterium]